MKSYPIAVWALDKPFDRISHAVEMAMAQRCLNTMPSMFLRLLLSSSASDWPSQAKPKK